MVDEPDLETKQGVWIQIFWDSTKSQESLTGRDSVAPQNT